MASIGGLSGSTSNSLSGLKGYGGLASGLDRDSLIESMTQGTTSKIYKQQQKKTSLQWEQTAIRNITDKMIAFSDKYLSTYSSSTNLFSSTFWGRNNISVLGSNSKYVSVSGSSSTADTLSILGVKQLAKKAQMTSGSAASDGILKTGKIDLSDQKAENLEGKTIEINYGDKNYTVTLPSGSDYKYDSVDNIVKSLNKAFENVELDGGKKLNDVLAVETKGDRIVFKDKGNNGNIFKLTGGTALSHLGFKDKPDSEFKEMDITSAGLESVRDITEDDIFTKTPFIDRIAGKELTFTYNGVSKSIKLPEKDALNNGNILDTLRTSMQKQLDDAFGDGRIKVSANSGGLQFKTTVPGGGNDTSSILSVSSGSAGLLGENGALNMNYGESNRVNMEAKISESGLRTFKEGTTFPATITINGVDIKVEESDTVRTLMDKINNSDAGVEVNYQNSSDKFVFTSKKDGASGKISVGGDFKNIFGTSFNKTDGQDAIVAVKYAGSDEVVEIVRDSNSFKIDGMTISVNGEFGYKAGAGGKLELDKTSDPVTFDAKVDEDKIVETIKKMVEEYNEIIELVGKETGIKPNRDYEPLTSAQKAEMSESEIEAWEEKAKEGLLFNDNDLKGLSNSLRFVVSTADQAALKKLGITTSSTASDKGKLSFDESAFRAALKTDPEGIREMFTKERTVDENGVATGVNGIAVNMKSAFDKYAKTLGEPKGILIERAGSIKSPASITQNSLYKQMEQIDKRISDLQDVLKMEQDRYIRQFTALESVIAQMNSQSGWLSQFGSGY
ncbi:flagellar filament capping protein FliD [Mediterraneibacter gnavus]|uniref:flagellar filament capping protein FliD n=1 Tax=Mediterraneibacter gnavus TaxID=33038 RepID=UPI0011870800|nr:flagellar filament capping protein FliD [Mediterraneibacter gnavus]